MRPVHILGLAGGVVLALAAARATPAEQPQPECRDQRVVLASGVRARLAPHLDAPIKQVVLHHSCVCVHRVEGRWAWAEFLVPSQSRVRRDTAFIYTSYLAQRDPSALGSCPTLPPPVPR